jgi:hypothetical protein
MPKGVGYGKKKPAPGKNTRKSPKPKTKPNKPIRKKKKVTAIAGIRG